MVMGTGLEAPAELYPVDPSEPIPISNQGLLFYKGTSMRMSAGTDPFTITNSNVFTVELWIKFNLLSLNNNGVESRLFCKQNAAGDCLMGIGATNSVLRIYLNGDKIDIAEPFVSNGSWRFLAVTYLSNSV